MRLRVGCTCLYRNVAHCNSNEVAVEASKRKSSKYSLDIIMIID